MTARSYNIIAVLDLECAHVLLCLRQNEPYKGLYNLPGGKLEPGEKGLAAAYRELFEETGITGDDITLTHVMSFAYHLPGITLEAYAGRLKAPVTLHEEAHPLFWHSVSNDFFDMKIYAGEGNIGHVLEQVWLRRGLIL